MTDVLSRPNGAFDTTFDDAARRTVDRRQLLRAGVWAAPVIVLATAAPAAAVSEVPTTGDGVGSATKANAIVKNSFVVYNENYPGRVKGSMMLGYDVNVFGDYSVTKPETATVSWQVTATSASGARTVIQQQTSPIAQWGNTGELPFVADGLAPGTYQMALEVVSVVFSPNPVTQASGSVTTFAAALPVWTQEVIAVS